MWKTVVGALAELMTPELKFAAKISDKKRLVTMLQNVLLRISLAWRNKIKLWQVYYE